MNIKSITHGTVFFLGLTMTAGGAGLGGCAMNQGVDQAVRDAREINAKVDTIQSEQREQAKLINSVHAALRNQAEMAAEFGRLQDSVMVLGGRIEELNARTAMLGQKLEGVYPAAGGGVANEAEIRVINLRLERISERIRDISARLSRALGEPVEETDTAAILSPESIPSAGVMSGQAGARQSAPPADTAPAAPLESPASPEPGELYQRAYSAYLSGQFADAVTGFDEYLRQYPNTELSDNALYWLAESHLGAGDLESASTTFDQMAGTFPYSNKAPTALLRGAQIFIRLGQVELAGEKLKALIEKYPTAHEAITAKSMLEEIDKR